MLIKIKVQAKQKKQEIVAVKENEFRIKVKAKPEQGRANEEVLALLARHFNLLPNKLNKIIEM